MHVFINEEEDLDQADFLTQVNARPPRFLWTRGVDMATVDVVGIGSVDLYCYNDLTGWQRHPQSSGFDASDFNRFVLTKATRAVALVKSAAVTATTEGYIRLSDERVSE